MSKVASTHYCYSVPTDTCRRIGAFSENQPYPLGEICSVVLSLPVSSYNLRTKFTQWRKGDHTTWPVMTEYFDRRNKNNTECVLILCTSSFRRKMWVVIQRQKITINSICVKKVNSQTNFYPLSSRKDAFFHAFIMGLAHTSCGMPLWFLLSIFHRGWKQIN